MNAVLVSRGRMSVICSVVLRVIRQCPGPEHVDKPVGGHEEVDLQSD